MILFDTSVIIDARDKNSPWHEWAKEQIAQAASTEGAAVNTITISEASVRAPDREKVSQHLEDRADSTSAANLGGCSRGKSVCALLGQAESRRKKGRLENSAAGFFHRRPRRSRRPDAGDS